MSLLWMEYEAEFQNLVEAAFRYEEEKNQAYFQALTERVRKIIHRDTKYNVDFLYTSYVLDDDKVMKDYAAWLYELMHSVLKKQTRQETAVYVKNHLDCIGAMVPHTISKEKQERLLQLLDCAKEAVDAAAQQEEAQMQQSVRYEAEVEQYLESLLRKNTRKTLYLIQKFIESGIPTDDIYTEILAESMHRIGELWHTAKITVDTEHYCTSVTQVAMAQMYPALFSTKRKDRKMLCACPGTELHEMGARMVADLFENDGWDTVYLGAAVPQDAMLESIRSEQPDLIALSVTMPQHLPACQELIHVIRSEFPDAKIAVGGNAFRSTHALWKKWPIDIYTEDGRELLKRANSEISGRK